jgi:hypothetical protein
MFHVAVTALFALKAFPRKYLLGARTQGLMFPPGVAAFKGCG